MNKPFSYVIVSPAKDEEKFISFTIESIISQFVRPIEFLIVNDGSKDHTHNIIQKYSSIYPWITSIDLPDRGHYTYGKGIIEAFNAGLRAIKNDSYDFIVKLDCDLSFDQDYFKKLLEHFDENEKLGLCSGQTYYYNKAGKLVWEDAPLDHVVGPCKMYRRKCFEEIKGPVEELGWDHIDVISAKMKGWKTQSFPELKIIHHRVMGSRLGIIKGYIRHGHADFITGYHPLYFFLKTIYRVFKKPYLIGSMASFYGFVKNYFSGSKKIVDVKFQKYYQHDQMLKLLNKDFWKLYLHKLKIIRH